MTCKLDIGPRAGGNMIPDLLSLIFDVNIVEMAVQSAMGQKINNKVNKPKPYFATHNLHSNKSGLYKEIEFSDKLEKYIIKKCLYKETGDTVEYFDNAAKALGIIFLKFENQTEMSEVLKNITDLYCVKFV